MKVSAAWVLGVDAMPARERAGIKGIVVHRIEVSQEDASYADTPVDVARFFREHPIGQKATGGAMPYPLLIDSEGAVVQTVPLGRVTPHARAHNPHTIGVGLLGDFRRRPPTAVQREALLALLTTLAHALGLSSSAISGHDELIEGSADPDKECPGRHLSMPAVRAEVEARLEQKVEAASELALVW